MDNLSEFFILKLDKHHLVVIDPSILLPTWYNRRVGPDRICKRVDRFLVSVDLLEKGFLFHQWVGHGGDSDHHPVLFQINNSERKTHCPFKFNSHCLNDESFVSC